MKIAKLVLIIVSCSLVVAGLLVGTVGILMLNFDFSKLSTQSYEEKSFQTELPFSSVSIDQRTANISFTLSEDELCHIYYTESENMPLCIGVENDTLTITQEDHRKWYHHIGIFWQDPNISIALPKAEYQALRIKASTADVELPNAFTFESAEIKLSTGDIAFHANVQNTLSIQTDTGDVHISDSLSKQLTVETSTGDVTLSSMQIEGELRCTTDTGKVKFTQINCNDLICKTDTGDMTLQSVIIANKGFFEADTGDIEFRACDAAELEIKTSTGDVLGTLLSPKIFMTKSSTGDIRVPQSLTGGKCQITTSTGDIEISIQE